MATFSVSSDLYVFKLKAYKLTLKVKTFQLLLLPVKHGRGGNITVGGFHPPRPDRVKGNCLF